MKQKIIKYKTDKNSRTLPETLMNITRKGYFRAYMEDMDGNLMYWLLVPSGIVDEDGYFEYNGFLYHRNKRMDRKRNIKGKPVATFHEGIVEQQHRPLLDVQVTHLRKVKENSIQSADEWQLFDTPDDPYNITVSPIPVMVTPPIDGDTLLSITNEKNYKTLMETEPNEQLKRFEMLLIILLAVAGGIAAKVFGVI